MATPMRSTDFRSVVEPILNEVFDGVYEQRADEWKKSSASKKASHATTMKSPSCTALAQLLSCPTAWQ